MEKQRFEIIGTIILYILLFLIFTILAFHYLGDISFTGSYFFIFPFLVYFLTRKIICFISDTYFSTKEQNKINKELEWKEKISKQSKRFFEIWGNNKI